MSKTSGAQLIVASLIRHNVKRVYIFPGGTFAPILDVIEKKTNIEIFCPRNEQGAGYAALADAKLTGQPSVFMVTSGPGVTNAVTPVADAYFDNIPMIVLTGQVGQSDMRGDRPVRQRGFQEVDTVDLMKPITKSAFQATETKDLSELMEKAFYIASEGRHGPVLIDLPMNIQRNEVDSSSIKKHELKLYHPPKIDYDKIKYLTKLITISERPVILAGGGIITAKAQNELQKLAQTQNIPITMSLPGIGSINSKSDLSLGLCGYAGSQYANLAIYNCDLLIAIGTTLHVRQTGSIPEKTAPFAKVARIDIDDNELKHSRVPTALAILGDAKEALQLLNNYLETEKIKKSSRTEWLLQIDRWEKQFPLNHERNKKLKPQFIIETVNNLTKKDKNIIVATGVGQHQIWVPRHFTFDYPDRILMTSSGHGTMGYDLPVAIGAKKTSPNSKVICIVGDGSLQMNIQEFATIAEGKMNIKIIVLDNKSLNIVAQFQRQNWKTHPSTGDKYNPDFAKIAQAYGIDGYTIKTPKETEKVLEKTLKSKFASLVHCHVDPKEDLLPMLLGGHTLDDMSFEPSF